MKKIMFNDRYGLTQAVLDGDKTQTRRISHISVHQFELLTGVYPTAPKQLIKSIFNDNSRLKVGEVVAVAQSYNAAGCKCYRYGDTDEFLYVIKDGKDVAVSPAGEFNKMFVLPELMPHQIRIKDVRVERLQDINEKDCLAEGIIHLSEFHKLYYFKDVRKEEGFYYSTAKEAYAALIDKVCGKGTWERNPFVFVYDFELVK